VIGSTGGVDSRNLNFQAGYEASRAIDRRHDPGTSRPLNFTDSRRPGRERRRDTVVDKVPT
jgi:hypothetical protein